MEISPTVKMKTLAIALASGHLNEGDFGLVQFPPTYDIKLKHIFYAFIGVSNVKFRSGKKKKQRESRPRVNYIFLLLDEEIVVGLLFHWRVKKSMVWVYVRINLFLILCSWEGE